MRGATRAARGRAHIAPCRPEGGASAQLASTKSSPTAAARHAIGVIVS